MNVLLATCMTMPHSGGASTHFDLLARSLKRAGMLAGRILGQHAVPSTVCKVLCALRARGARDPMRAGLLRETAELLTRAIDASLASRSADVVHCHDALSAYAALNAHAVQERGLPVVETIHGPWSREILASGITSDSLQYREARRIEETAYAKCTHFIAVDRGQADILSDDFSVAKERVSVIHNAVDCAQIHALGLKGHNNCLPEPYFLVPRRLVAKNGVHVAIEAMEQLADETICLAIAGHGPLAASLRDQAERAGVARRVHFLGNLSREQLTPLMASSTGVIVPSVPCEGVIEATSLAVIEAFACGVPAIASNIGGLAELIQDGRTGFLFPPGNANALADTGRRLLRMAPPERMRLCAAARDTALARWDVSPWFTGISRVYERALPIYRGVQ
jgi:glycosyltransferase involved in cell wall biosynthesis